MTDLLTHSSSENSNNTVAEEIPLPTENEIENMLAEIRQIEQEEIQPSVENKRKEPNRELNNVSSKA